MASKQSTATPIKLTVAGRESPPAWAKEAGVAPDEAVQVIIGPSREQAAVALRMQMEAMSQESKEKGLTEEALAKLLEDG